MKIVVLLKKVPDTGIPLKVNPNGDDILRDSSLTYVINPYDEYALEEAIRIREKVGEGEIVVYSLGDEGTKEQLRNALALGADRAILLKYDEFHWLDGITTAKALLEPIREENPDLILTGKTGVDLEQSQVPVYLAEFLDLPQATGIIKLELGDGKALVERETEAGIEKWEVPLPAVFTCEKGLNEPRLPTLKGIMMAKKKSIEEREIKISEITVEKLKLEPPPEKKAGRILDIQFPENVKELVRLLREEGTL
jgi:electron transfer flavoprotein beta subunit